MSISRQTPCRYHVLLCSSSFRLFAHKNIALMWYLGTKCTLMPVILKVSIYVANSHKELCMKNQLTFIRVAIFFVYLEGELASDGVAVWEHGVNTFLLAVLNTNCVGALWVPLPGLRCPDRLAVSWIPPIINLSHLISY